MHVTVDIIPDVADLLLPGMSRNSHTCEGSCLHCLLSKNVTWIVTT